VKRREPRSARYRCFEGHPQRQRSMKRLPYGNALRAQSSAGIGGLQERVIQHESAFRALVKELIGFFGMFMPKIELNVCRAKDRMACSASS
jgi:hypothetical protein